MPNKKVAEWKGVVATTKPKFPWTWVGIGGGLAALIGLIAATVKKKR